jgi:hypothetical protein
MLGYYPQYMSVIFDDVEQTQIMKELISQAENSEEIKEITDDFMYEPGEETIDGVHFSCIDPATYEKYFNDFDDLPIFGGDKGLLFFEANKIDENGVKGELDDLDSLKEVMTEKHGWTKERFEEMFDELIEDGAVEIDCNWKTKKVYISVNSERYYW